MVTRMPRDENTDANSAPITPPPIISRLSGACCSPNSPSLVRTPGSSSPSMGRFMGFEPEASSTCVPFSTRLSSSPSHPVTSTVLSACRVPVPLTSVTLFALKSCSTPCLKLPDVPSLYSRILSYSYRTFSAKMPNCPPSFISL